MSTVLYSFLTALILGLVLAPLCIPLLRALKFGQRVRTDGPQSHLQKQGTPTMGGIIILLAMLVSAHFWSGRSPAAVWTVIITVAFGLLGFLDDYIKVVLKRPLGLTARQKMAGQLLLAAVFTYAAVRFLGRGTDLPLPWGGTWSLGPAYYLLAVILIVGTTNAVNLTDGLDGLASGISLLVFLGYAVICLNLSATSTNMDYRGLAAVAAALAGGCLAFLCFNRHPARVFMGDTGSLALGGGIAALAILSGSELLLPLLGGIFVLETLSVVLQVASFKMTGKRIFRMSPLHHHFELLGWPEQKVVALFWAGALVCVLLGLMIGAR